MAPAFWATEAEILLKQYKVLTHYEALRCVIKMIKSQFAILCKNAVQIHISIKALVKGKNAFYPSSWWGKSDNESAYHHSVTPHLSPPWDIPGGHQRFPGGSWQTPCPLRQHFHLRTHSHHQHHTQYLSVLLLKKEGDCTVIVFLHTPNSES